MLMEINGIKLSVTAIIGAVGACISNEIGGFTPDLMILIEFMILDFCSGVLIAAVWHKSNKTQSGSLSSYAGLKGITKKMLMLCLVFMGAKIDILANTSVVRTAVIYGLLFVEGTSILENLGQVIPIPKILRNALDTLQNKAQVTAEREVSKNDSDSNSSNK